MNPTRMIMCLALVAVFGFLNAFLVQNYGQGEQAGAILFFLFQKQLLLIPERFGRIL